MIENINVMITEFSMQMEEDTAFYLRVRFHCAATKTHREGKVKSMPNPNDFQ